MELKLSKEQRDEARAYYRQLFMKYEGDALDELSMLDYENVLDDLDALEIKIGRMIIVYEGMKKAFLSFANAFDEIGWESTGKIIRDFKEQYEKDVESLI